MLDKLNDIPYAEWLEEGLRTIFEIGAQQIALCAIAPDGEVLTGYYECSANDKAIISHAINADAMLDMVLANVDKIREALEEEEA